MATAPSLFSSLAPGQLIPSQQQKIHSGVALVFQRRRSAISSLANAMVKSSRKYSSGTAPLHNVVGQNTFDLWKPRINFQTCQAVRHEDVSLIKSFPDVIDGTVIATDVRACMGEEVAQMKDKFRMDAKTGAFQQLPMVSPAYEILGSALRKARMVRPTKGIMNVAKRERNRGAKQLDALIKELALPLKMYLQKFPPRQHLHAYESALLELTLGDGKYEEVLERVDYLRKKVLDSGKNYASLCAKSTTKLEAEERLTEGFTKLEEVFNKYGKAVDDLKEHAKKLRAMPVMSLRTPTLCLVGAPNVGKSSLVRILSSGKPEICNYQFTTRGISLGHFEVDSRRFQVTDTPGLLERPDEERNNMEKLTLAALSHLPTSILYVHDLTGECGSSAAKQFKIYTEIKGRYSDRPWLDVVSKADLLSPPPLSSSSLDCDSVDSYVQYGPRAALRVSTETGEGVAELEQKVHALLTKAHPDQSKDEDSTWGKAQPDADAKPVLEFYYPAWPRKQEN